MTFTIEQLEALKEGTTPGSWEFVECSENQYGDPEESRLVTSDGEDIAYDIDDSFGKLIAAAPDLVDALIAEKRAHQETLHLVRELWSDVYNHGNVGRASTLRHLTRILEGDDG